MSKTEHIQESSKKRRIRKACNFCRSKKAKCDGALPSCSTCIAASEICTYSESSKRRGLPTGYTHDLEKKVTLLQGLLSELLKNMPDKELESKIFHLLTNQSQSSGFIERLGELQSIWDTNALSGIINQFITKNGPAIHEAKNLKKSEATSQQQITSFTQDIRNIDSVSRANEQLTQILNSSQLIDSINGFQSSKDTNFNYRFNLITKNNSTDNLEHSALKDAQNSTSISGFTSRSIWEYKNSLDIKETDPFRIGSIFNITSASIMACETNMIELPKEIFSFKESFRDQINQYFTIYHSWIPLVDRILIIRKLHEFKSFDPHITSIDSTECNIIALLWAIIALGESTSYAMSSSQELPELFAKRAIMALEKSPSNSLESIQASVLLSLFYYQIGKWDYSWVLICSGARSALDARLMSESSDNIVKDKKSKDKNKILDSLGWERTWSSVYVVNTLLAARLGRTLYIKSTDWPVPKINEDGWEEWEHWKFSHSVNPIELESGRCLSTYNKLIEVISILNLSITCTIDITDCGQGDELDVFKYMTRNDKSYTYTLSFFKKKLDIWSKALPDHCKLDYFSSIEKIPPMVALLHLSSNLIWCILAVRLYNLKEKTDWVNISIAKLRDQYYTNAISTIRQILNSSNIENLKYYPFIDYFLLMALNYPEMMTLEQNKTTEHCEDIKNIFIRFAQSSIPATISWNIFQIMKEDNKISDTNDTKTITNLSMSSHIVPRFTRENIGTSLLPNPSPSPSPSLSPLPLSPTRDEIEGSISVHTHSLLPFNNSLYSSNGPFGNRFNSSAIPIISNDNSHKIGFQPQSQMPPNQALSMFMLDSDFVANDLRFDTFMKNLGYISNDKNKAANESQNTTPLSTATLSENLEMQLGNEIENIGIRDYIQRMSERNG